MGEEANKYLNGVDECGLREFVDRQKKKEPRLRYLLPLDFELAVIVYPSPEIKILAQCDGVIRKLIERTRNYNWADGESAPMLLFKDLDDPDYMGFLGLDEPSKKCAFCKLKENLGETPERRGTGGTGERMMLPMEIDLDTMSHF